jgi:hypothetical protein
MYELFSQQFEKISFEQFVQDLDEKSWVLLLEDEQGVLRGLSSMDIYDTKVDGRPVSVVYSGDTVVDSDTWRDSALSYYWMGAVGYLQRVCKKGDLHWFLLVSGYRSYRFLPVYSEHFYPRHDRKTPDDIQLLMDTLAAERFGDQYDPATGIVQLKAPSVLKAGYCGIPQNRLADPHIAYFAQRNPGHEKGDELVCYAELAEDRLTRLGRRMWIRGQRLFPDDTQT